MYKELKEVWGYPEMGWHWGKGKTIPEGSISKTLRKNITTRFK